MMRLRQRDLKEYVVKRRISKQDDDGTSYKTFDKVGTIKAKITPAGGELMIKMYGEKMKYMLLMLTDDEMQLEELDGICVHVDDKKEPDYKIKTIAPWDTKVIHLEKV